MAPRLFPFLNGKSDGDKTMKQLVGAEPSPALRAGPTARHTQLNMPAGCPIPVSAISLGTALAAHIPKPTKALPAPLPLTVPPQLGGKGANLCEMARHGLDVPPGFTITTEVCQEFYACGERTRAPAVG